MKTNLLKFRVVKYILGAIIGMSIISAGNVLAFSVVITTNPVGQTQICQNNVLTLKATVAGHTPPIKTITWSGAPFLTGVGLNAFFAPDNTTLPGSYTITCTVKDFLNVVSFGTITIEVKESPIATISALGPTTFCQGGSVVLSAFSDVGYTFQWRRDFVDISGANSSTYTATTSGEYDVVVTNANGCDNYSSSIIVTVNSLPAATASSNSPVCYNGAINLSSTPNGMVSYSWTSTAVTPFSSSAQNPIITNATQNNSGDYTVTVTDINSCVNTATTTVLVYNDTNGGTIGTDHSICYNGDPNALTNIAAASGGDPTWSYSWESFSGGGPWTTIVGATTNTYDPPAGLTQTTQYRRVATNSCGVKNSNTVTVTVYSDLVGGTIGSDQALCSGADPAAFTNIVSASGGNVVPTYSWESRVLPGSWTTIVGANTATYDVPAGITQTTDYRRVATNLCGTVYSNIVTITITPALLNNNITAPAPICSGSTPALIVGSTPTGGSGAYTYQWQVSTAAIGGPYADILVNGTNKDYQPGSLIASTWYQRIASSGSCISTSPRIEVTVNPLPAPIGAIKTDVCVGSTINLTNATSGGTWSSSNTAIATVNATTGVVTGVAGGTVSISYTLPTTCSSSINITVNSLPAAITGVASVCVGSTTTFACTTPGGIWSSSNLPVATIDAAGVISGISAGTSSIRYTLPLTGCFRARNVTVVAIPTITLAAVTPVCQDATSFSLPYTARTGTPTTYSISAGVPALAGFVPVVNAPFGASPFVVPIPAGSAAGTYQFVITVRNATGCVSVPVNFNVTINPIPAPITGTTTVCVGSTTFLANITPLGTWSSSNTAVATISPTGVVTGVSAGTSVISYTLGTGCNVTTTVTVNPLPAAITGNTSVCIGATTSLSSATAGGTWLSESPGVATIDAAGLVTGVTAGTAVIRYTIPATTCYITTTVTVNALPTLTLGTVNAVCKVANSFSLPYTATTGIPTTYSISSGVPALAGFVPVVNAAFGASPLSITIPANSTPGTYQFTITVRNGNGCVSTSQNFNLTINDLPTVTFGGVLATQCITSTTYVLTGGLPVGGTYSGPGVAGTNFNASVAGAGTHTITYTYNDVNGCSGSATNTITVNPAIGNNTISTATPSICYNTTASLTGTTPTGGDGVTYTYKWQSSPTGLAGSFTDIADINSTNKDYTSVAPLTANTWYRRLVSSGPCTDDISNVIQITVGPIFTVSITPKSPKCVGTATGEATANPVGGTPAPGGIYTYSWDTSPIQTNQTATSLSAGIPYTVTVTDNIGCTATSTVTLTDPTPVTLGLPTIVDVTGCFGGNNGSISIQASGGTGPYKYDLYNNSVFVATQTVAGAVTFTQPTTPITASTQYEVRVTDANGCVAIPSGPIEVKQPALLVIDNVAITDALCYGGATGTITITASGGTVAGTYTYSIDGEFGTYFPTNTFTVASGDYDIWVKDDNGCTATWGPIFIDQPEEVLIGATFEPISNCFGDLTGRIVITPNKGAIADYDYTLFQFPTPAQWVSTNDFTGLAAGSYYPQARSKATGCIITYIANPVVIQQPSQITFSVSILNNVTGCWYSNNGRIRVHSISGGATGAKQIALNNTTNWLPSAPGIFDLLVIGNHTVYVKDSRGCIAQQTIAITGPTPITLDAPPTIVGLSCNNVIPADGSISLSASGGAVGALSYSIDGGAPQVTGNFAGVSGGDHTITITDVLGCHLDVPVNVPEPPAITFTTEQKTDITCFGAPANGTITLLASGGTGALTYTLNPGAVNSTPGAGVSAVYNNLAAGPYTYFVTDSKGCISPTNNLSIDEPLDITVVTNPQVDINCSGGTGLFSVDASGGTGSLVYSLYDNTHTFVIPTIDGEFPISVGGTYTVEVTDANGCGPKIAGPLTFSSPTPIVNSLPVITPLSAPGANDGSISLNATGGTPDYTFTLNPSGDVRNAGSGVDVTFPNLSPGNYSITITDTKGCSITVDDLRIGILDLDFTVTEISCNGKDDGQIALTISGGTEPYTIRWSNSAGPLPAYNDIPTIGPLKPETYTVNVVDVNGLMGGPETYILLDPPVFDASVLSINDKQCFGNANGSVEFSIIGGSAPYTITWTEGSTPRTATVIAPPYEATNVLPGTYTFTVTSSGTCGSKAIPNVTLTDPTQLTITDIDWNNPCFGQTNGSVIVTATGGSGTLTYSLTGEPNNNNGIFNNLAIGSYTVTLTDANSCVATSTIPLTGTLDENPDISIVVTLPALPLKCSYSTDTIKITVAGGTPGFTYSWDSNPISTDKDLIAGIGSYIVTVTDAIGCTKSSASNSITGPKAIAITDTTIFDAKCSSSFIANGFNDVGSIEIVSVEGGTGPGTYECSWNYPIGATGWKLNNLTGRDYVFTIKDANNCVYSDTLWVGSDPNYNIDALVLKDASVCGSASFDLEAFPKDGTPASRSYTYKWFDSPLLASPLNVDLTLSVFRINPKTTTRYYVQIENDGKCIDTASAKITIYPKINLSVPPYISALRRGDNILVKDTIISILQGNTYNLDVIAESNLYPTKFKWKPEFLFEPDTSWNSSIYIDKEILEQIPQNGWVTLKDPDTKRPTPYILVKVLAETSKGCKDSLRLYTKIVDNIAFGNVFSPNDDGINDVWLVPKDYLFPDLNIEVFNRWGARVWSATGDKASRGWNGKTDNGKELPIGTYYYVVKFNVNTSDGNWKPLTGSVTIIR